MKELKISVFEQMIIETPLIPVYILHHKEQKFPPNIEVKKIIDLYVYIFFTIL